MAQELTALGTALWKAHGRESEQERTKAAADLKAQLEWNAWEQVK